jgi:hypothetical protein
VNLNGLEDPNNNSAKKSFSFIILFFINVYFFYDKVKFNANLFLYDILSVISIIR